MADAITQSLGFDASGAIASIGSLNKSLSSMGARLKSLSEASTRFNAAAAPLPNAIARIDQAAAAAALSLGAMSTRMADASRAASALGRSLPKLGEKFTNAAAGADAMAAGIGRINAGNLGDVAVKANEAAAAMRNLNKATKSPAIPTPGGRGSNVVSWQTIGRVVETQALLKSLGAITEGFHYATESAIEFSQKVAEIRTISSEKNLDRLKQSVAGLAAEFNRPLSDVAEGYYQTLSNQVGGAAESEKFLADALKFSKVAVTETGDAVNLLAGALHSFQLPTEQAADIAAKFFKTIELGRVRGSELAASFPRVATVAHQVGVSIEELQAAFDTMTHKGVAAREAATQISGALTSLFKPTKDGAEALAKLGYASGEDAVAALSFQGALQALVGTTDGSTTAIAKLVPRVRGLSYVLAATGESADFYNQTLAKIKATTADTLDKEYQLQITTNAEQVTRELNKLKIALTNGLGESLLAAARSAFKLAGGADNIAVAIEHLLPVLALAGTAAVTAGGFYSALALRSVALAGATGTLAASTRTLGGAFKFAFGWAGVALTAYEAATFAADLYNKSIERQEKLTEENAERLLAIARKATNARLQEQEDENAKVVALIHQQNAGVLLAYNEQVAGIKATNDQLVSETKDGFGKLLQAREAFLGQLRTKLDAQKRLEETVTERIDEGRRRKDEDNFEHGLRGKTDKQKVEAYSARALQAANQVEAIRSDPNATPAQLKAADQKEHQAERNLGQARALVKHEDSTAAHDAAKAAGIGRQVERGQENLDVSDTRARISKFSHDGKKLTQAQRRALVGARAANRRVQPIFPGEDFGGEARELNAALTHNQKAGRLETLRQKQRQGGIAAVAEKQDADLGDAQVAQAEAGVRGRINNGNVAQLANTKAKEAELEAAIKKTAEENKRLQGLTKEFYKNVSQFDKKTGKPLAPEEQAKRAAKARAAGAQILELTIGSNDEALQKQAEGLKAEITKRLTDEQIQHLRLAPGVPDSIRDEIQSAIYKTVYRIRASVDLGKETGHDPTAGGSFDPSELGAGLKESSERLAKLRRDQASLPHDKADVAHYQSSVASLVGEAKYSRGAVPGIDQYDEGVRYLLGLNGRQGTGVDQERHFKALRKNVGLAGKNPLLGADNVDQLQRQADQIADPDEFGYGADAIKANSAYKKLQRAIEQLRKLQGARDRLNQNEAGAPAGIQQLNQLEQKTQAAEKEAAASRDVTTSLNSSTPYAAKIAQLAKFTGDGYERAAKAIGKIRPLKAPDALKDPNDNFAAHGGTIRRFSSGGTVGTDTVPAMLTPGEIVWDAQTSRNFAAQLTAINAGSRPPAAYPASNITQVGDINVTVPGGPTTAATARQLADMTRRELRRRS